MNTATDPSLPMSADCNDMDANTYPGATELCGMGDNNCNGTTSDEMMVSCYPDADEDTYAPTGATATPRCPATGRDHVGGCPFMSTNRSPSGGNGDCADADPTRRPGVPEICDEPGFIDQNCNGPADEGNALCHADGDDDGWALAMAMSSTRCIVPARVGEPHLGCPPGFTGRAPTGMGNQDCNDTNVSLHT
jgi:hypothetical protein